MSNDKLKPCPFCGGDAFEYKPTAKKGDDYVEWTRFYPIAMCDSCNANIAGVDHDWTCKTAVVKWNTRNNDDMKAKIIEAVEKLDDYTAFHTSEGSCMLDKHEIIEAIEKVK